MASMGHPTARNEPRDHVEFGPYLICTRSEISAFGTRGPAMVRSHVASVRIAACAHATRAARTRSTPADGATEPRGPRSSNQSYLIGSISGSPDALRRILGSRVLNPINTHESCYRLCQQTGQTTLEAFFFTGRPMYATQGAMTATFWTMRADSTPSCTSIPHGRIRTSATQREWAPMLLVQAG